MDAAAAQRRRAGGDHSLAAVILGNDALVAARPATPAQLANACIAAGFDLVVPPAWGDELVATGYLERLAGRREPVIVACACPRVAALAAHAGTSLPTVGLAAPPVAVARALRAVHGEAILITYVGSCPSASDPSIDVRFSPSALFAQLDRQEVRIAGQPTELAGAEGDRWRRYASVPGGLPALRFLARSPVDRVLRTLDAASFERGEIPPSRSDVLVDLAGAAQCACGGPRDEIEEGEPRRSTTPVVQCPLGLPLDPEPTPPRRRAVFLRGPTRVDGAGGTGADSEAPTEDAAKSGFGDGAAMPDTGSAVAAVGAPVAGAAADGADKIDAPGVSAGGEVANVGPLGVDHRPASRRPSSSAARSPWEGARITVGALPVHPVATSGSAAAQGRGRVLTLVPALVLVLTGALGVGVYATSVSSTEPVVRDSSGVTRGVTGVTPADTSSGPVGGATASRAPNDSGPDDRRLGTGRTVPASVTRAAADSIARNDSVRAAARRRARRAPAPAVVPGWMPQGRPTFVPRDTGTATPDSSAHSARPDATRPHPRLRA